MKKRMLTLSLVLVMILGTTIISNAETAIDTRISSTDAYRVEQGSTITLTATTSITGDNEGQVTVQFVSDSWTGATEQSSPAVGALPTGIGGSGGSWSGSYTGTALFDATVKNPGFYEVTYQIEVRKQRGASSNYDEWEDADEVDVEVYEVVVPVYVEPMAAPAVAAKILEFNGIGARYGSGRTGGNFIADVAAAMGPQTLFNGVPKEMTVETGGVPTVVSNPTYRQEVLEFLNDHVRMTETLEMPTEEFLLGL
ncbi:hypothetical protein [Anaerotalea alkaliphila]|uniref:Uncharacterized protein n=1 Tax=Anaerotalea alkaliphila TaxID=2662126 RepID=A0A7X5HVL5_9FIRM|nr:hypothetical protein [Anaerotalea alkaliphila]NDL67476.1 hypothetical protein [Anaerotalea alkaliphila]